jgi:glycosyltransferase involved in cell wall biosynthesis
MGRRKILIVATADHGGAGEAMLKLSRILLELGHEVIFLVKDKSKSDLIIKKYYESQSITKSIISYVKNWLRIRFRQKVILDDNYCFYAFNEIKKNINVANVERVLNFSPEIIFSGWTSGFLNSTDLLNLKRHFDAKIYTITVDMNHFTGGCHYAWDCKGYIKGCDNQCPAILTDSAKKIARVNFETKLNNAKLGNFQIISGSGWTFKQAKESLIYRHQKLVTNINSLIDTRIMNSKNRKIAKDVFGLDKSKFYILMGCQNSNDSRKGFDYLLKSLINLHSKLTIQKRDEIRVIIVSSSKNEKFAEIPFEKVFIDFITDYKYLALLYQAADVFVNSSIEDSGPMMVSEALACGTPVVGFDMGVVNNLVISGYNGYKASLKDACDLGQGIENIFSLSSDDYMFYSENAVKQIEQFSSFEFAKVELEQLLDC